jgi:hypothetical protein
MVVLDLCQRQGDRAVEGVALLPVGAEGVDPLAHHPVEGAAGGVLRQEAEDRRANPFNHPPAPPARRRHSRSGRSMLPQQSSKENFVEGGDEPRAYRSSGRRPVDFAILARMRGPSSSSSWNAKTTSGHPGRLRVRCEPDCRLMRQPSRRRALSTPRALAAGQRLTRPQTARRAPVSARPAPGARRAP